MVFRKDLPKAIMKMKFQNENIKGGEVQTDEIRYLTRPKLSVVIYCGDRHCPMESDCHRSPVLAPILPLELLTLFLSQG